MWEELQSYGFPIHEFTPSHLHTHVAPATPLCSGPAPIVLAMAFMEIQKAKYNLTYQLNIRNFKMFLPSVTLNFVDTKHTGMMT